MKDLSQVYNTTFPVLLRYFIVALTKNSVEYNKPLSQWSKQAHIGCYKQSTAKWILLDKDRKSCKVEVNSIHART